MPNRPTAADDRGNLFQALSPAALVAAGAWLNQSNRGKGDQYSYPMEKLELDNHLGLHNSLVPFTPG